jgi:FkbM family methyltransferase
MSVDDEKNSDLIEDCFNRFNIHIRFDENEKKLLIDQYVIYYSSKVAVIQTLDEVFLNMAYYFRTNKANPFIVDAGSEVGVVTIFFKLFYPGSKILCFEPHPCAFRLLEKNIKANKLSDTIAINAALANKDGVAEFFGEFDSAEDVDTRGSSIIDTWGLQRETSSMIQVKAVKLSEYINQDVDYLKLNVEGAEQQILEDLDVKDKIKFVDKMLIKFHSSAKTKDINDLDFVYRLLSRWGFVVKNKMRKKTGQIFPDVTKKWAEANEVRLYTLAAKKIESGNQVAEQLENTPSEAQKKFFLLRISSLETELFMLKSVIDNVPASVYWKNKDGYYLGHSAYATEKLQNTNIAPQATVKNIVGKSDYDIFTKEVASEYRKNDVYVMENKKRVILEESVILPNGEELVQLSSKKPLYDERGEVVGIIGSTIDITERKRAEVLALETKIYKKQLEEQERFKIIAGQVAHDIRSPLASLSMIVESYKNLPEPERLALREVATGINDIANNLLSRYKKDGYKVYVREKTPKPFLVSLALSDLLSEKKYKYKNFPAQFKYSFNSNSNFAFIKANHSDFNRMMSNLVDNAVEALEGKAGKVDLSLKLDDKRVEIIVQDNGKGMSPKIVDKIISGDVVVSDKNGGSGIGLAQVRETLLLSNGKLSIDSKIGEGTRITLVFPRSESADWIAEKIELNQGATVIILDDDVSIHNAWEVRFKDYIGIICLKSFKIAEEAIEFINAADKDKLFLLIDFELIKQKLSGLQVIEQTSMQRSSILVTSHYAHKNIQDLATKAGVKILPKQLSPEVPIEIRENSADKRRN